MNKQHIKESFSRTSGDKLNSLEIGKRMLIQNWIDEHIPTPEYCIINNDLTISTTQDINIDHDLDGNLPEYIQFDKISGYFSISHNKITSLRGCPKYVYSSFYCNDNDLTSLEYGPSYVGKDIICTQNQLSVETLYKEINKIEGFKTAFTDHGEYYGSSYVKKNRRKIDESFKKTNNKLSSLGIGKKALIEQWLDKKTLSNVDFIINDDLTIDCIGDVYLDKHINGNFPDYIQFNHCAGYFSITGNNMTSLRGCPKEVTAEFYCDSNLLTSLEYAPLIIGISIDCSGNNIPRDLLIKQLNDIFFTKTATTDFGNFIKDELKTLLNVNEGFSRGEGEKLSRLGVGKKQMIEKWLDEKTFLNVIVKINNDLTIDCIGDVYLDRKVNGNFPDYIQFNRCEGYFSVSYNNMTSLRGCPKEVSQEFYADSNLLTSLEFIPSFIGAHIECEDNKIPEELLYKQLNNIIFKNWINTDFGRFTPNDIKIKGRVDEGFSRGEDEKLSRLGVGKKQMIEKWLAINLPAGYTDSKIIINSDLTLSAKGHVYLDELLNGNFPDYIKFKDVTGYFSVSHNNMTSLKGCPDKVGECFYCDRNLLTSLEFAPKIVSDSIYCQGNNIPQKILTKQLADIDFREDAWTNFGKLRSKDLKNILGITESFSKTEGDKLNTLGIGRNSIIKEWLENHSVRNYFLRDDGIIDIVGAINLDSKHLKDFPDYIKFGNVTGFFSVSDNEFTNMKGFPDVVEGSFYCSSNKIINIDDMPLIKGSFGNCLKNPIPETDFYKKYLEVKRKNQYGTLYESFVKSDDKLSNIGVGKIAAIKNWLEEYEIHKYTINSDLTIDAQSVMISNRKELEYLPNYINFNRIEWFFAIMKCNLKSLRGCPRFVGGAFNVSVNNLNSLEFEPDEVGGNYWCDKNNLPSSIVQEKQAKNII